MDFLSHDPSEYIRGIQQVLISDKKRIGFLFGAGSSLAQKSSESLVVPAITKMTELIVEEVGTINENYKTAFEEIKDELGHHNFNIESILSNLEQKASFIGKGTLNSMNKEEFDLLILEIKKRIRKLVSVHIGDNGTIVSNNIINELVHSDFARWIGQAERKYPIEIFTTNYDFLFELGLEYKNIAYYDGFSGSLNPFFNSESVEDFSFLSNQTKLWKIHGSLGWHLDKCSDKIIRRNSNDDDILIYPSSLKYKHSKKQPYESLLDRLSNFIKQDDSILITCGYSWGDEHINSRIVAGLKTNTTSHVIGLLFDKYDNITIDSNLTKLALENSKMSIYASKKAIIGCQFGEWKLKYEPSKEDRINVSLYFKEDVKEESLVGDSNDDSWTGKGEFLLSDFSNLTRFLNQMISDNEIRNIGNNVK